MSVVMREMPEAGIHFDHQTRFWNPEIAPYIFGHHSEIHIINPEKTLPMYQGTPKYVCQLAINRGIILFIGTKYQSHEILVEEVARASIPFVDNRWFGDMLTNFKMVRTSIKRLKDMGVAKGVGAVETMSKKRVLMSERKMNKLVKSIDGIKDMGDIPDAVFIVDVGYHRIAVAKTAKLDIPMIGVVDTNHSSKGIDYIILGSDGLSKVVTLYTRGVTDAILEGRASVVQRVVETARGGDDLAEV